MSPSRLAPKAELGMMTPGRCKSWLRRATSAQRRHRDKPRRPQRAQLRRAARAQIQDKGDGDAVENSQSRRKLRTRQEVGGTILTSGEKRATAARRGVDRSKQPRRPKKRNGYSRRHGRTTRGMRSVVSSCSSSSTKKIYGLVSQPVAGYRVGTTVVQVLSVSRWRVARLWMTIGCRKQQQLSMLPRITRN